MSSQNQLLRNLITVIGLEGRTVFIFVEAEHYIGILNIQLYIDLHIKKFVRIGHHCFAEYQS